MEKNDCYIGLELTSSSVKLVAGYVLNDNVYILNTIQEKCNGLKDGRIDDVDEAIKVIKNVINTASSSLNMAIDEVTIAIPPFNLLCIPDIGSTNTIDGNDIIRHVDTTNIITAMKKRSLADPDLKIIDIVPDTFIIGNNEQFVTEPIGKISKVLSLHASIYAASERVLNQFVNCVNKAGYQVKYAVIAPYATSLYLSLIKNIPDSYLLVDIGHSVTTISHISHKTSINFSKLCRFGGNNITMQIASDFNLSLEDAERLKTTYGIDHNLNFDAYIQENITLDDLADSITKSLIKVIDFIRKVINDNTEVSGIPIVLVGGTSYLNQIKKVFRDELQVGIIDYYLPTLGARDRRLITSLGLIKYCSLQPKINEEETVTTQVNRVTKKNRNYDFDEEL